MDWAGTGRDLSVHHSNENHSNENDLSDAKMNLNEYGKIVDEQIIWLQEQYQYAEIHNYVIMPNHVHMIIEIDRNKLLAGTEGPARELYVRDKEIKVKSLSSLIGAFKTTSSKKIHQFGFADFAWQRSFHDHII